MFTILDYSSALEYSIIRRYTNIVYYYYYYYYNDVDVIVRQIKRTYSHFEYNYTLYAYFLIKNINI